MRPTRYATAMLLLAAIAAVGCSKRGDNPQTKAGESKDAAQAKTVTTPGKLPPSAPTEEEGFTATPTPEITGPVTFADGETAYHAKKYSEATKIFEHYTTQKPDNAWGHFMFGLSASKSGDLAKAEKSFEAALMIDPDHLKSLTNLSRVLIDQKRHDDALDKLMHAGDVEPNSNDVYRLMGRAYHAQGKAEDAVTAYRRAIELDEKDAWSMNNLGLLFLETKRAEEALPLLAKAVELKKDVPAFHNNLGMALEHTGRFGAAATAYAGALTADPAYDKAKQNLTRVEGVKNEFEKRFDFEKEGDDAAGSR
jgi:tetratricopeptide (TPR) repeat protein